jgi:hypothetical protein
MAEPRQRRKQNYRDGSVSEQVAIPSNPEPDAYETLAFEPIQCAIAPLETEQTEKSINTE